MARALRLAERGRCSTRPNPRVGCVLVRDGSVVGEGFHHHAGGPHAERVALAVAGEQARGATAYVTLEPCCHHGRTPPCTEGLIEAGIQRVVYAADDANPRVAGGGARALRAEGIVVTSGLMAAASRDLNRGFFSRHERGRPWLTLKLGMSLDGRVALANGASQWITGDASRADVQRLRAGSCAILTGIGTVLDDDPRLDVRDARFDLGGKPPARVVLDSTLRLSPSARLLTLPGVCHVFTTASAPAQAALEAVGAQVHVMPGDVSRLDLPAVFARLAALDFNEVLAECGPTLAGALLDAGLVDELVVYIAPMVLGAEARGAFASRPLQVLQDATRWQLVDARRVGSDLRLRYFPASP